MHRWLGNCVLYHQATENAMKKNRAVQKPQVYPGKTLCEEVADWNRPAGDEGLGLADSSVGAGEGRAETQLCLQAVKVRGRDQKGGRKAGRGRLAGDLQSPRWLDNWQRPECDGKLLLAEDGFLTHSIA